MFSVSVPVARHDWMEDAVSEEQVSAGDSAVLQQP